MGSSKGRLYSANLPGVQQIVGGAAVPRAVGPPPERSRRPDGTAVRAPQTPIACAPVGYYPPPPRAPPRPIAPTRSTDLDRPTPVHSSEAKYAIRLFRRSEPRVRHHDPEDAVPVDQLPGVGEV